MAASSPKRQDGARRVVGAVQVHADHHVPEFGRQPRHCPIGYVRSRRINQDVDSAVQFQSRLGEAFQVSVEEIDAERETVSFKLPRVLA